MKRLKFLFLFLTFSITSCKPDDGKEESIKRGEEKLRQEEEIILTTLCEGKDETYYRDLSATDKEFVTKKVYNLLSNDEIYFNLCKILNFEYSYRYHSDVFHTTDDASIKLIILKFRKFLDIERGNEDIVKFFKNYTDIHISERLNNFRVKNLRS